MADWHLENITLELIEQRNQTYRLMINYNDEELVELASVGGYYKSQYTRLVKNIIKKFNEKNIKLTPKQRKCLALYVVSDPRN